MTVETSAVPQALIEDGRKRSTSLGCSILVSFTYPATELGDPVSLFSDTQLDSTTRVLWANPSKDLWKVGVGAAFALPYHSSERFKRAKVTVETWMSNAVVEAPQLPEVGPIVFGGFRFDVASRQDMEWHGSGDGLLILPRLLYSKTPDGSWLTENVVVHPNGHGDALSPIIDSAPDTFANGEDESLAREGWCSSVRKALNRIKRGELKKVVLARRQRIELSDTVPVDSVLRNLINREPECTVFAFAYGDSCFLGATPELLVKVDGDWVESHCLAGSAPRGATNRQDLEFEESLLKDGKERWEHSLVVDEVREILEGMCIDLHWEKTPQTLKLRNVQHLATAFRGTRNADTHVLDYVEGLHPTPAVAGSPRDKAIEVIRQLEGMDRGWYAGPIGWMTGDGGGEFTVAIRSALIRGNQAFLYSGAGIVEGSDPEKEFAETELKFGSMVTALREGANEVREP